MRALNIGYACLNRTIEADKGPKMTTFRLASYSPERQRQAIAQNLAYVQAALAFNVAHDLRFLRLSSDIVPFGSHEVSVLPWREEFAEAFKAIGNYAREHGIRLAFHPDQFVLINSPSEDIFRRSAAELSYHADMFRLMGVGWDGKLQIHVGGVYGDKEQAKRRFAERFALLPEEVRKRLVIENDDRLFSVQDCLDVHAQTGVPVLVDVFHHACLPSGETMREALERGAATWQEEDGAPIVDYSSQQAGKRVGAHADSIVPEDFVRFVEAAQGMRLDVMLEIKDKEVSALRAHELLDMQKSPK